MDLKELINLYRRWIWLLVGCLVFGLAFGFLASKIQAPVYEASTRVLVVRSRQQSYNDMLPMDDQQLVMTYQQLLKTRPVLEEAERLLGIEIEPDDIQISTIASTQIIEIKVQDKNARQAVDIANIFVQILIKQNETLQAGRYAVYEQSLNSQITQVQQQINTLQDQITQINQTNVQEQLALVNQQITDLQIEISTLEKDMDKFPAILSTVDRAALSEKQSQLNQLGSLLYLYQQIKTNLTYIGKPMPGGTENENPQITTLQSTLNLYQELYLNLLNNIEAVKLTRTQSIPAVIQIEEAVIPEEPVRPISWLYTVLSGLVGFLIAAGTILLMDYFDDSFKTVQNVKEIIRAPVIGQVLQADGKHAVNENSFLSDHANGHVPNAFGSLRINLSRLMAEKRTKAVLVTSSGLGDGSTPVAANLAKAFAQTGKKVVLVDANLRSPQIHAYLKLENKTGLAEILSDGIDWQEVVCCDDNLTIITGGQTSTASIELLESDKLCQLLEKLQKKADIVIVDSPPLCEVEAQILASKVGEILWVVQQGRTKMSTVQPMVGQLALMDVEVLGVVLNRISPSKTSYLFN